MVVPIPIVRVKTGSRWLLWRVPTYKTWTPIWTYWVRVFSLRNLTNWNRFEYWVLTSLTREGVSTRPTTVLEVYNLQGIVFGIWGQRSGLGVVWSVSINSAPSKGPSTTLVPCQLARIKAGTQESMELNCHQGHPPPLVPPDRCCSRFRNFLLWALIEKLPRSEMCSFSRGFQIRWESD